MSHSRAGAGADVAGAEQRQPWGHALWSHASSNRHPWPGALPQPPPPPVPAPSWLFPKHTKLRSCFLAFAPVALLLGMPFSRSALPSSPTCPSVTSSESPSLALALCISLCLYSLCLCLLCVYRGSSRLGALKGGHNALFSSPNLTDEETEAPREATTARDTQWWLSQDSNPGLRAAHLPSPPPSLSCIQPICLSQVAHGFIRGFQGLGSLLGPD